MRLGFGLSGIEIREAEVTPNPLAPDQKQKIGLPFGRHKSRGQEYTLQLLLESNGTKSAFSLLSSLSLAQPPHSIYDSYTFHILSERTGHGHRKYRRRLARPAP